MEYDDSVSVGAAGVSAVEAVLLPPPLPPPQAATRTVTKISQQHRRPLPGRISVNSPIVAASYYLGSSSPKFMCLRGPPERRFQLVPANGS
jgi:hypothetical protein